MRKIEFKVLDPNNKLIGYERLNDKGHWEKQYAGRTDWLLGSIFYETFEQGVCTRLQYMNIIDKNEVKIWEGDILKKVEKDYSIWDTWEDDDPRWNEPLDYEKLPLKEVGRDVATMSRFPSYWLKNESFGYEGENLESPYDWEVIGNKFDNPKLLQ